MKKLISYVYAVIYAALLSLSTMAFINSASIFMSPFTETNAHFYSLLILFTLTALASVIGIIMTAYANFRLYPTKLTVKIEAVIAAVLFIPGLWAWDTLFHWISNTVFYMR